MKEVWKSVSGYKGFYEVSNLGNVRSVTRKVDHRTYQGIVLKPYLRKRDNRRFVNLKRSGIASKRTIASLVAEAFLGKRPHGCYVLHKNDDLSDDSALNLYYGTPLENARDCKLNGRERYVTKESHGRSKLSEKDVDKIRSMCKDHYQYEVAEFFSISQSHVSDLVNFKKWR